MRNFQCGGKVILLGEYAVLDGGMCLVTTTKPEFELALKKSSHMGFRHPFAPESPAGLLIQQTISQHVDRLAGHEIVWKDPYDTPIGVGSSSAQFVLTYQALCQLTGQPDPISEDLLQDYWYTVANSQGLRPSGADVICQWLNAPVLFRNSPFYAEELSKPALEENGLQLWLAYTGSKLKTHEHLQSLFQRNFPHGEFADMLRELNDLTAQGVDQWRRGDWVPFGKTMSLYQDCLSEYSLSANHTLTSQILAAQKWEGVLGAKGCGAQGGDCVLILSDKNYYSIIKERCRENSWTMYPVTF
jgi:mevalonate kinase